MRIWVYGDSLEQIQNMIEKHVSPNDTVAGTSIRAEFCSAFPYNGLTPAISSAIRGEIDLLLIPSFQLLGDKGKAEEIVELFQNYGVSVKSVSNDGINSS